jgi:integrase
MTIDVEFTDGALAVDGGALSYERMLSDAILPTLAGARINSSDQSAAFREYLLQCAYGPELPPEDVHRRIVAFSGAASANTRRALLADLKVADAHQQKANRPALPVDPRDLYMLIHGRAAKGAAKSSIDRLVASMVRIHEVLGLPSPVDDNVRWKQKEIRREDRRECRQARGLRLKGEAEDVVNDAPHPVSLLNLLDSIPTDPAGLRDRALISVGYDAGLRRSELVPIEVEHFDWLPNGEASLLIPRSKTDQAGEGARVWQSKRSVRLLKSWLEAAEITSGPVFRALSYRTSLSGHLSLGTVSKIIKARLRKFLAPLVAADVLTQAEADTIVATSSAHSVRVGCDQDLFAAGVDIGAIMQGLRWSSPKQPLAYARHLAPASSKLAATMRRCSE